MLSHRTLVELIEKLGYPVDKLGMCHGFAVLGMQAILAKKLPVFINRLILMNSVIAKNSPDRLVGYIAGIENDRVERLKKYRRNLLEALNKNADMSDTEFYAILRDKENPAVKQYNEQREKIDENFSPGVLEVHAFLQLMSLYFSPQKFPHIFNEDAIPYGQDTELALVRGLPDSLVNITTTIKENKESGEKILEYHEESTIKKAASMAGLYNENELAEFFKLLNDTNIPSSDDAKQLLTLSGFDPPLVFLLSSGTHTIAVAFDNNSRCWQLIDANKLPLRICPTNDLIASEVLSSLSKNTITTFKAEIYCAKDQVEDVKTWFSELRDTPVWKKLHDTRGKEQKVDSDNTSLLFNAACVGDVDLVNQLVESSQFDSHQVNINKLSPLHMASLNGHAEVVEILLKNSKDPNERTPIGNTALHLACGAGSLEVVKILLADPNVLQNVRNTAGATPLHAAAQNGSLEISKTLLADSKVELDVEGFTPLHVASECGHVELVKWYLSMKEVNPDAETPETKFTSLHNASLFGTVGVVQELLKSSKVNPNKTTLEGNTALHLASNSEITKALLARPDIKADQPNDKGFTPLHMAMMGQKTSIIEALLERPEVNLNAETFEYKWTPLHLAVQRRFVKAIETLLESSKVDPNKATSAGNTPLHMAVQSGRMDIVKLLLSDARIKPDQPDNEGWTPLHMAIQGGHMEIIQLLLSNVKVNPEKPDFASQIESKPIVETQLASQQVEFNKVTIHGSTPLHIATQSGKIEIVKMFLAMPEVNPAQEDNNGWTPLHLASQGGSLEIVKLLLARQAFSKDLPSSTKASVEVLLRFADEKQCQQAVKDLFFSKGVSEPLLNGFTPLHAAIFFGHTEIVKALIAAGFDVNTPTKENISSMEFAKAMNHVGIVKILEEETTRLDSVRKSNVPIDIPDQGAGKSENELIKPFPMRPRRHSVFETKISPPETETPAISSEVKLPKNTPGT